MHLKHSRSKRGGGVLTQTVVFVLCAGGMLALGWLVLLPGLFTSVIQDRTGFPAKIDYFYANPFTAEVRMRGLVIMNPAGFADASCLEMRQFTAKADLFSLLSRTPVLDMSTIDVARITVVTNANGTTNLDLIGRRLAPSPTGPAARPGAKPASTNGTADAPLQFLVRNLNVRVNQVVIKDERPGTNPQQVHQLAFQRSYQDVTQETRFNTDLPPAVTAAGKEVGERVNGALKTLLANTTQPIPHQTYAWGDKSKKE